VLGLEEEDSSDMVVKSRVEDESFLVEIGELIVQKVGERAGIYKRRER
jgi:hypothetical protein